jgi:hypothetical protein
MKGSTFVWLSLAALLVALLMRKPVVTSTITYGEPIEEGT